MRPPWEKGANNERNDCDYHQGEHCRVVGVLTALWGWFGWMVLAWILLMGWRTG